MRALERADTQSPDARSARSRRGAAMLRITVVLARTVVAAVLLCTALAYVLAQQADDRVEAEHRAALTGAVEALATISPDLARADPNVIRVLERASGLKELKLNDGPVSGREMQPMLDGKGRIVGWFSWETQRPATAMLERLLPFVAGIVLALLVLSGLAMRQLGRLGSALARSEQRAQTLEQRDLLTGLHNHGHFLGLLDAALASRKAGEALALAVLDLDGFDEINDGLGHAGGDEMLVDIAGRLRESAPEGAILARLGSDEFALLVAGGNREAARQAVEATHHALARPFWKNRAIAVSATMGIAFAPGDGVVRDELMRRANLALRAAKQLGRGSLAAYAPKLETELKERRFIKRELARALAARAFDVHYQPIVRSESGAVTGVEALLRWDHPERGPVPPSLFVPLAEEAGLMEPLGELVLRRAIADAARWPGLYMSVNVSPVQVRDRRFGRLLAAVLEETAFPPRRLVLEVTESVLINKPDEMRARLMELRALGVQLALDDFGSGYSSLSYLQKLPFHKLKVDRSFVAALDRSAKGGVIVQAIVALGRALGMAVVIEGVESEAQRALLRLAGGSEMQGYLFGRPGPREEIDRILRTEDGRQGTDDRHRRDTMQDGARTPQESSRMTRPKAALGRA